MLNLTITSLLKQSTSHLCLSIVKTSHLRFSITIDLTSALCLRRPLGKSSSTSRLHRLSQPRLRRLPPPRFRRLLGSAAQFGAMVNRLLLRSALPSSSL
ncbi:unnamed protein product [Cuscuta epithymum]|uniref:Uncharacterized protein n=1 Tax=Cuscuta epithymum TaxID=186058 RepID=A0AAV0CBG3_9ASTE|nr:unnamed protein product [Cuscuta epithymum]